ncbi:MAG: hypothetical protein JWO04_3440 [Gammaproteobacteria bacterium]|nr:hypothetical protein [Gammaproteobacteria bacterium]
MKRALLLGLTGAFALAQGAVGQNSAATPPPATISSSSSSATAQPRPDAKYPNPSGQDSQPSKAPVAPKKATGSAPGNGNVESRGTRTSDQSAASQGAAKQKVYKGNTGKKPDPGTACSTARPTNNGGVDCGTGGKGATPGKVPK